MNITSHLKIESMKRTCLRAWPGDKDELREFDLHRGLLIAKFLYENSTKSEAALKMALSRFK